jgi:hypothetical protein
VSAVLVAKALVEGMGVGPAAGAGYFHADAAQLAGGVLGSLHQEPADSLAAARRGYDQRHDAPPAPSRSRYGIAVTAMMPSTCPSNSATGARLAASACHNCRGYFQRRAQAGGVD